MAAVLAMAEAATAQDGVIRGVIDPQAPGGIGLQPRQMVALGLAGEDDGFDLKAIRTAAVPSGLRELVARLDDPDWQAREEASRRLEAHPADDDALLRILDQDELSEEQRQRLMAVVAHRIMHRERGAIGIRMNPRGGFGDRAVRGIEVTQLIPGLPAERVLKVGDVITRIDEREIRANSDLITYVQRMPPGRVIEVVVLRPRVVEPGQAANAAWIRGEGGRWFERIDVEFALGSFEKLGDTAMSVNPETGRRQRLMLELRRIWDRPPDQLDGNITIDGVMQPDAAPPRRSPIKPGRP